MFLQQYHVLGRSAAPICDTPPPYVNAPSDVDSLPSVVMKRSYRIGGVSINIISAANASPPSRPLRSLEPENDSSGIVRHDRQS